MSEHALPLIGDRHTHVSLYAALAECPSLAGLETEEALRLLASLPDDRLNTVISWHSGRTPLPPNRLEALPPALILNVSLHGLALTGGARALLKESDPELVACHGDSEWSERNLPRLFALYGATALLTPGKLDAFMHGLEALGVGAAEDMLLTDAEAWRVIQASPWAGRIRWWTTPGVFRTLPPGAQEEAAGLKLFLDGSLGARTAALSTPYLDGRQGLLTHTAPGLREALASLVPLGKALAVHAIGDRAIQQALDALGDLDREGLSFPAVRLEHAQFITEAQARRARDRGLVLSMQPNFNSDSVDYADRLPPEWLAANDPFRMLIDRVGFVPGRDLIFGSDGMPHGLAYAAQWSLFPAYPGQRLTLDELMAGFGSLPGEPRTCRLRVDEVAREATLRPEA